MGIGLAIVLLVLTVVLMLVAKKHGPFLATLANVATIIATLAAIIMLVVSFPLPLPPTPDAPTKTASGDIPAIQTEIVVSSSRILTPVPPTPLPVRSAPSFTATPPVTPSPTATPMRRPTNTPFRLLPTSRSVLDIVSRGAFTCVLMNTGKVKCWGDNGRGALGDGTRINRMIAVDVLGINDAIAIASGAFHNCALLANGGVKCWGQNDLGQLGNGTFTDSDTPSEVIGLSGKATQLSINGNTTCARMEEGTARCWGANGSGQIGDGTTINRSTPVKVSGLSNVVSIAAGYLHSCALIGPDSIAVCWGANSFGEIGDGTKNNRLTSVPVIGLSGSIAKISPGGVHTCVLYTFGNVQCWGADHYGQLGNGLFGASSPTPVDANGLYKNVVEISAQSDHTCVMFDSGGVRCWGRNHQGQIGDGTFADKNLPTQVIGLSSGAVKILAGLDTSCAILDTGSIKCWGSNTYGQAGDGTTVNRAAPVNVLALDRN